MFVLKRIAMGQIAPLLITVSFSLAAYSQTSTEALPLDLLPRMKTLSEASDPAVSSNGEWVAYQVVDNTRFTFRLDRGSHEWVKWASSANGAASDIWVTNIRSGESINLTGGRGSNWGPSWSPDNSSLAYFSDATGRPQLWIWDLRTRKSRVCSPATVLPNQAFDVAQWTADSTRVLLKILPEGVSLEFVYKSYGEFTKPGMSLSPDVLGATVTVYSSPGSVNGGEKKIEPAASLPNRRIGDLALIHVASGKELHRVTGFKPIWYRLSPDGSNLAFAAFRGVVSGTFGETKYDLMVVPIAGGSPRTIAASVGSQGEYTRTISWSPDGRSLAFVDYDAKLPGECFVINIDDDKPVKVSGGKHPSFSNALQTPLWDKAAKNLYFLAANGVWRVSLENQTALETAKIRNKSLRQIIPAPNRIHYASPDGGRSAIVMTRDDETKQTGFYQINLSNGSSSKIYEADQVVRIPVIPALGASEAARQIVFNQGDAGHAADIWIVDLDSQGSRRVTSIAPEVGRYTMGKSRLIEWKSLDGKRLRGALLLPADYKEGQRYPLIVNVYGGVMRSNEVHDFGLGTLGARTQNMQLLATRGYAVLSPDAPLGVGTPMVDLVKTVLPGVEKVIELGIADPEGLGVMGRSYGGYSTLGLITQTNRFRAAVSWAGFGNYSSMYGVMLPDGRAIWHEWAETGQGGMQGTPWEYRERYIENSPQFYLNRIQTPLFLAAGTADTAVAPHLSEDVFVGLRRLGKEVAYARYEGEPHEIFKIPNQIDFWNKLISWFDKHLKAAEKAEGRTQ